MSETGILGAFRSHAFLANLSQQHLMILASGVKPFTLEKDKFLVKEGTSATTFFLIQSGRAAVEIQPPAGSSIAIQTIGPGEIVGWSWIIPNQRWQFDCRVLDTVQGLAFDANWLRDKCEHDHELGYHLLKQLVTVINSRLVATRLGLQGIPK